MKKFILILTLAGVSGIVFAQLKSSVIKNTANEEVFSIGYGSGAATVTVNGVVSPSSISVSGAAVAAPTNTAAAAGLPITVNGTNYIIRLLLN
jgi:hypothetical protein